MKLKKTKCRNRRTERVLLRLPWGKAHGKSSNPPTGQGQPILTAQVCRTKGGGKTTGLPYHSFLYATSKSVDRHVRGRSQEDWIWKDFSEKLKETWNQERCSDSNLRNSHSWDLLLIYTDRITSYILLCKKF